MTLRISEILFNPPGSDAPNEYIELQGTPNTTIPQGTYLVGIEGDTASNPGDVQNIFNLSGFSFGNSPFLVLRQKNSPYSVNSGAVVYTNTGSGNGWGSGATSSISHSADIGSTDVEDATVTFMLIQSATVPTLSTDIDSNNDGIPDGTAWSGWTMLDSVSILDGGTSDIAYGNIAFRFGSNGGITLAGSTVVNTNFQTEWVSRRNDSTGYGINDWIAANLSGNSSNWTINQNSGLFGRSFQGYSLTQQIGNYLDAVSPSIINVTTSTANGTYNTGATIPIQVKFQEAVWVTGTPTLTLETGNNDAVVSYSSGSGTDTLTFNYTVAAEHQSVDLDYVSSSALSLNGGSIVDRIGNATNLALYSPGTGIPGTASLGSNKDLQINPLPPVPVVTSVTSDIGASAYGKDTVIPIKVVFDRPIAVTGTPTLTLETGVNDGVASYVSGSGTNTLTFNYRVWNEEYSSALNYQSTSALSLNGGTIKSSAGIDANLTLPTPSTSALGQIGIKVNTANPNFYLVSPVNGNMAVGSLGENIQKGTGDILVYEDDILVETIAVNSSAVVIYGNQADIIFSQQYDDWSKLKIVFSADNFTDLQGNRMAVNYDNTIDTIYVQYGLWDGTDVTIQGYSDANSSDLIWPGWGNDIVTGGSGNDMLGSELGSDTLTGGAGQDRFWIYSGMWEWGNTGESTIEEPDLITDFNSAEGDRIFFQENVFSLQNMGNITANSLNDAIAIARANVDSNNAFYAAAGAFFLYNNNHHLYIESASVWGNYAESLINFSTNPLLPQDQQVGQVTAANYVLLAL